MIEHGFCLPPPPGCFKSLYSLVIELVSSINRHSTMTVLSASYYAACIIARRRVRYIVYLIEPAVTQGVHYLELILIDPYYMHVHVRGTTNKLLAYVQMKHTNIYQSIN